MSKNKLVSYGYVGRWNDGTLGWFMPRHLSKYDKLHSPSTPYVTFDSMENELGELCEITIKVLPNKRRRRIKK